MQKNAKPLFSFFLIFIILPLFYSFAYGQDSATAADERKEYTHFSLVLPDGWDGEEQKGFISDNPDEYLLTLGKKDESGDTFLAQVSVYLLPNRPGVTAAEAARILAEAQGDAGEPVQVGKLWTFTGTPRSNIIKGGARTYVNTNKERMLIIIVQDPQNLGGAQIFESLKGTSPQAIELSGK